MTLHENYKGIVVFGCMGSGKDTVSDIICHFNKDSKIYNIGYLCREVMKVSSVSSVWKNRERELAQKISAQMKSVDKNILNEYTYANTILDGVSIPIICGGRTKDDYLYWKQKGFYIIGVDIDENIRLERLKSRDGKYDTETMKDKTESEVRWIIDNVADTVIMNNGTLEELKFNVKEILNSICINKVKTN